MFSFFSSYTPKNYQEGQAANTINVRAKQESSVTVSSNNSDIVEDSEIENDYQHNDWVQNRVVESSDNSNDNCSTSTFSLPLAHSFFGNPQKVDKLFSTEVLSKPKIQIISDVIIAPPTNIASSPSFIETENIITPETDPNVRSPEKLNLLTKSEIEILPDSQRMQTNTCETIPQITNVASHVSPEKKESMLETGSEEPGTSYDTLKGRKRVLRKTINKAHIDFISEDEQEDFSPGSSDEWSNCESDVSSEDGKNKKRKKKTKTVKVTNSKVIDKEASTLGKKKEKRCNVNKLRKKNKNEGKSYETRAGVTVEEKKIRENPCVVGKCVKFCYEIPEERRHSLFNHFWGLDSQRRRDWILRCVQRVPIKRKRTTTPESRRTATYEYFINNGEDHRKVCQKFLINTLDITQKLITYTIQHSEENMAKQDMRKPNVPQKYTEVIKQHVSEFIEKLPVLPSHYNRPKTGRVYLPQEYKSLMNIYRKYLEYCKLNEYLPVSEPIFRQIFNEYNISIHIPKKDKCKTCTDFENNKENKKNEDSGKDSDEESEEKRKEQIAKTKKHEAHLIEKNATYRRFKSHQNINLSNDTITTSFDLQKVLNTPYGESMLLYYSRKYAVYNLTFYESGTQDVFCYTWGESDGNRGSNEIATCLLKYLADVDRRGVKNLLLYCDSCSGQNKNKTVLTALNLFLKSSNNLQVIQINFLLPGHTYMPVDSVHAVIEREVKRLIVWSPSQWPTYFQSARKNPRPYKVEILDHTDFLDFEDLAEQTFTPLVLKKVRIQQIRTATFKKKYPDQIRLKYSMTEEAEESKIALNEGKRNTKTQKEKVKNKGKSKGKGKGKGKATSITEKPPENVESVDSTQQELPGPAIKRAYYTKLPISVSKYKDLMRLCDNGTIPRTYHNEYRQIPHEESVCDFFPHSDYEEDQDTD